MGTWSSEAPTLPGGSEWSAMTAGDRTYYESYRYYLYLQFARLSGRGFAIKITIKGEAGTAGTTWWNNTSIICMAYINNTLDSKASGFKGPASKTKPSVFYFIGEADEGDVIKITLKGHSGAYSTAVQTYTAPALLGNTVFVNIGGAWKQGTMFVNVSGVWKQCFPKVNIGGVWK